MRLYNCWVNFFYIFVEFVLILLSTVCLLFQVTFCTRSLVLAEKWQQPQQEKMILLEQKCPKKLLCKFLVQKGNNIHSGPENLKKSRQKNSWNQINHFFSWNCISGSFKLFPSSKNWFLAIFEITKNRIWSKNFCEIDLFDFTSFFWPGLF